MNSAWAGLSHADRSSGPPGWRPPARCTCGPALFAAQRRPPLSSRYSDLRRHFLFEYYPWYRNDPWEHWPEGGHHPPADFGSNFVPALGLYDSRSTAVMERHARWIAESGVGAIDVSWWGPDSNVNEVIPTLMDVMKAHDIHVTFYVEPYTDDHARELRARCPVPDQELRRSAALGLLPAPRIRGRHRRSGLQVLPDHPA